jgi:hypothetical protein
MSGKMELLTKYVKCHSYYHILFTCNGGERKAALFEVFNIERAYDDPIFGIDDV